MLEQAGLWWAWFGQLVDSMLAAATSPWVYPVLSVFIVADAIIPMVPSESLVVALASLLVHEKPWLLAVLGVVSAAAAWVGDNLAYAIGRTTWLQRFAAAGPRRARLFGWAREQLFRRGATLIIVGRFIPGARIAINMACGTVGFSRVRFMQMVVISSTLWAGWGVGVGSLAGAWFAEHHLLGVTVAIVVGMVLGTGIDALLRRVVLRRPGGEKGQPVTPRDPVGPSSPRC